MSNHHHAPQNFNHAFAIGISLNLGFVIVEAWYGWQSGSLALLADAGHNLSDVGGLLLAWAAMAASNLKSNERHSYGWRRGSILASFTNALLLLVAMGFLSGEAVERLAQPSGIAGLTVIIVATIGVVLNSVTAWLFLKGSKHDLNIRGAFLHMAADALVSAGVIIAGILYLWKEWSWLDPVVSLIIAGVVIIGTWSLFKRSLHLLFDGVPDDIDLPAVSASLIALPGVNALHDLHIWALSTTETALTAHLVVDDDCDTGLLLCQAEAMLHKDYELHHVTLQIETHTYADNCHSGQCGITQ